MRRAVRRRQIVGIQPNAYSHVLLKVTFSSLFSPPLFRVARTPLLGRFLRAPWSRATSTTLAPYSRSPTRRARRAERGFSHRLSRLLQATCLPLLLIALHARSPVPTARCHQHLCTALNQHLIDGGAGDCSDTDGGPPARGCASVPIREDRRLVRSGQEQWLCPCSAYCRCSPRSAQVHVRVCCAYTISSMLGTRLQHCNAYDMLAYGHVSAYTFTYPLTSITACALYLPARVLARARARTRARAHAFQGRGRIGSAKPVHRCVSIRSATQEQSRGSHQALSGPGRRFRQACQTSSVQARQTQSLMLAYRRTL
eukprot:6175442-Pleurochrysis_carterae.AAC.1